MLCAPTERDLCVVAVPPCASFTVCHSLFMQLYTSMTCCMCLQNVTSAQWLPPRAGFTECLIAAGMAEGSIYIFRVSGCLLLTH